MVEHLLHRHGNGLPCALLLMLTLSAGAAVTGRYVRVENPTGPGMTVPEAEGLNPWLEIDLGQATAIR